jgi:hypothetical protein
MEYRGGKRVQIAPPLFRTSRDRGKLPQIGSSALAEGRAGREPRQTAAPTRAVSTRRMRRSQRRAAASGGRRAGGAGSVTIGSPRPAHPCPEDFSRTCLRPSLRPLYIRQRECLAFPIRFRPSASMRTLLIPAGGRDVQRDPGASRRAVSPIGPVRWRILDRWQ